MCIVCVVPRQVKLQQFLSKLVDKFVARLHRWVCVHTHVLLPYLRCLSCALVQLLEAIALALHGSNSQHAVYVHAHMYVRLLLAFLPCVSGVCLSLGVL